MICSSVNRERFICPSLSSGGIYLRLEEFQGVTSTGTYTFTTATGTTIVPVGTIRMVAFNDDGPTARAMWRGKDGLNRFFGLHFNMKTAAIMVMGYIEQTPTQKNHEFYNGVCRITD